MDLQVGGEVMGWWWVGLWMDGCVCVCVGGGVHGWIYRWVGLWTDGCVRRWMDGFTGG